MQHPFAPTFVFALCMLLGCEVGYEQPSTHAQRRQPSDTGWRPKASSRQPTGTLAHGRVQFVEGYAQGCALAASRQKPMMLFFTAHWCEYCRQMVDEAFTHPQVVRLSDSFVCVLVDADREAAVCRQFAVSGYPTIQFLSPRGAALSRVVGKKPAGQVTAAMQAALAQLAKKLDAPRAR
jgi:thiol:disulfide interchange protein